MIPAPDPTASGPVRRSHPVTVLCVCTGNIARSPVLAQLLDRATDASVSVVSAGTGALTGAPLDPPMASLLKDAGVAPAHHRARDLTERAVAHADLVLCLDTSHRRRVVELTPAAMRRTFLVGELARLTTALRDPVDSPRDDDAGRLRALVASVLPLRGGLGAADQDDVADPYGGPPAAYRAAFADIAAAVTAIRSAAALRGPRGIDER